MQFNEYQELAQRTANKKLDGKLRIAVAGLGLVGEGGEVTEHIKKFVGHGHYIDQDKIIKELGDVLWYVAEIASLCYLDMEDIAKYNIEKLKARYPEGLSEKASMNRLE